MFRFDVSQSCYIQLYTILKSVSIWQVNLGPTRVKLIAEMYNISLYTFKTTAFQKWRNIHSSKKCDM